MPRRLKDGEPLAVTLRVARQDGASEVVDRRVVFLVRSGEQVKAIDSTCTHLGCRTRFNAEAGHIECPCHGGVYDVTGQVVSGPPPQGSSNCRRASTAIECWCRCRP